MGMTTFHAYRAGLLRFDAAGQLHFDSDGLLLTAADADRPHRPQRVRACGAYAALRQHIPEGVPVQHWPDRVIAPGFVDLHVHYPQVDVIGSPAEGLLPWLTDYTFPQETRFADATHAQTLATVFLDELQRHGVTTALAFATSHSVAVDALCAAALARRMRLITGLCLMDRHAPDGLRNPPSTPEANDATERSLIDTDELIQRWHERGRLGYAITPRFVPTCSDAQLKGAGELAARYPSVWVQSHVSENREEIAWVRQLHPQARSYLDVYHRFGLVRPRSVYAHGIYLDDSDRALLREQGSAIAVSPTSNLFLGSGLFDFDAAQHSGHLHGLASDVGGGTSFSPFVTMRAAYMTARMALESQGGKPKTGLHLTPSRLWWLHTVGAAQSLGLNGVIGNLQIGAEADFVVLNPNATPLLARRTQAAHTLEEWLFACIILGDDRLIERVVMA